VFLTKRRIQVFDLQGDEFSKKQLNQRFPSSYFIHHHGFSTQDGSSGEQRSSDFAAACHHEKFTDRFAR